MDISHDDHVHDRPMRILLHASFTPATYRTTRVMAKGICRPVESREYKEC